MKRLSLVLAAAAVLLSACYNNGYYGYTQPTPGPNCTVPKNSVLVYPSNSATGVPDNAAAVYVAEPKTLPSPLNQFDLDVVGPPSYGSQLTKGFKQVSYSQIPTPNTVPSYANPVYYESQLNAPLSASSTFDLYWNNTNNNCTTGVNANLLGSFTTQ
jgi:hypothetical protein